MWITPPQSHPTENQPRVTHNPMGAPEAPSEAPFPVRYIITDFFYSCEHSTAHFSFAFWYSLCVPAKSDAGSASRDRSNAMFEKILFALAAIATIASFVFEVWREFKSNPQKDNEGRKQ